MGRSNERPLSERRRRIVKGIAAGIFGLGALEATGLTVLAAPQRNSETDNQSNEAREVQKRLDEQITLFAEQDPQLSQEDIHRRVLEYPWIPRDTKVRVLPEQSSQGKKSPQDLIDTSLNTSSNAPLEIVLANFDTYQLASLGGFYKNDIQKLFFPHETTTQRKNSLETHLIHTAIFQEYQRRSLQVSEHYSGTQAKEQIDLLCKWREEELQKYTNLHDLPGEYFRHSPDLITAAERYRFQEAIAGKIAESNLPHELFHYFFDACLQKEGYEGPSAAEFLATAYTSKRKRFGEKEPEYNDNEFDGIEYLFADGQADDPNTLKAHCEKLLQQCYAITEDPPHPSEEELRTMSAEQRADHEKKLRDRKNIRILIEESFARVFNAAQGNTPENVRGVINQLSEKMNSQFSHFHGEPPRYLYAEMYHDPFDEEIQLLQQVTFNGNSLFKK